MIFIGEQKDEVLEMLYRMYDEWQGIVKRAKENKNVDACQIAEYEKNLDKILDFTEEFKANGEIEIQPVHLWTICNRAIFHTDENQFENISRNLSETA